MNHWAPFRSIPLRPRLCEILLNGAQWFNRRPHIETYKSVKRPMRETIYIIDGHSQIFRAYFSPAARGRSVRGRPVGAVFLFTRMLIRLIKAHEPDYLICTLDPSGGTFRNEIFPDYKANRDAMPEDLQDQMPLIVKMIEAFGVPIQMVEGFEADDVIGTLSVKAEKEGLNVRCHASPEGGGM